MNDLNALVCAAAKGNNPAFAQLINMFQDIAYGYAYSLLSDFHLAQDAAQEAFIEAYYNLRKLMQ